MFWISLVGLIVFSCLWRLRVLDTFPLSYDEGIHLILARLWAAGHTPYAEIFVSYPPSFMWSLGVPWQLFNQAGAVQVLMMTYALAGVLAVVYLGSAYNSRLAGLVAGLLLSFAPAYFIASFTIMTEVPSISMAVVAIAFAEKYRRSGSIGWIALAGITLAFGLSLKVLPAYAAPYIVLVIISRHLVVDNGTGIGQHLRASKWPLLRDMAVLAVSFLLAFLIPVFFFDLSSLYEQVVRMRLVSRDTQLNPFESNSEDIVDFLFGNPGITALALYGLVFVVAQGLRKYWLLAVWFSLVWISMVVQVPLRPKHLPIFLPVLVIFAGFAVNHMLIFLKQVRLAGVSLRSITLLFTILVIAAMVVWRVPHVIAENNGQTLVVKENEERLNAVEFIDRVALPDDCVIADNPVFLYQTRRLPPPELSETSQTRIDTGYLTLPDVIGSIQTHKCHIVAVVSPRFGESIPGLREWLADNYLGLYAQSETFVYFAKKGADDEYVPVHNGKFGDLVLLYGLHLSDQPWHPGDKAYVSLFWRLESPMVDSYIEKIELRDASSHKQVYEIVRSPFEGLFDTTEWHIKDQVKDTFRLDLPGDLPAGTYDIYLSLCSVKTESCLAVNRAQQTGLKIGQMIVQPASADKTATELSP
jgi:hypothetical protein